VIYEVEAGGKTFEIEAPNIKRAESAARLFVARSRMTEDATAGAQARSEAQPPTTREEFMARAEALPQGSPEREKALNMAMRLGEPEAARTALGMTAAMGSVGAAGGVVPFAKGAALGVAGGFAGKKAAEAVGAPGWVGATAGALAAPAYGPKLVTGMLSGKGSMLAGLLGRLVPAAEQKAATVAAKGLSGPEAAKAVEVKLAQLSEKRAAREAAQKLAERRIAVAEERNLLLRQRLEGRAAPASQAAPQPAQAPATADPSATMPPAPELEAIVLKIQQTATSPAERKVVQAWLKDQPKEVASQIRLMLARRQAHPATVYTKPSGEDASADLARMLGQ
jgi:hypothetical protein